MSTDSEWLGGAWGLETVSSEEKQQETEDPGMGRNRRASRERAGGASPVALCHQEISLKWMLSQERKS